MIATMHGKDWSGENVSGWYWSEKFDGWRALWDGARLWTRQGCPIAAPAWWTACLHASPLDGELYLPGGTHRDIQRLEWDRLQFRAFDVPILGTIFEDAITMLGGLRARFPFFKVGYGMVRDIDHARQIMRGIVSRGGEGIMLRRPGSEYVNGRCGDLLKLKP